MEYDSGSCVVKYILFGFNFIMFLVGTVLVGVGIWLLVDLKSFLGLLEAAKGFEDFNTPAFIEQMNYAMLIFGACLFFISFLGCCGAIKESRCMLTLYGLLIIAILIVEIMGGVLALVYKSTIPIEIKKGMKQSLDKYDDINKDAITLSWDATQKNLHCCGVENSKDYSTIQSIINAKNYVPKSCCKIENGKFLDCMKNPNIENSYFQTGCYQKIYDWIKSQKIYLISFACALILIEIVIIIFAFCLAKSINSNVK